MIKSLIMSLLAIGLAFGVLFYPIDHPAEGKTSWRLVCAEKQPVCQMTSFVKNQQSKIVSIFTLKKIDHPSSKEKLTMALLDIPLGLHIPTGVMVKIDNGPAFKATLIDCSVNGCRAIFNATSKVVQALQNGNSASLHLLDSKTRKKMTLTYSLVGFSKIWNSFVKRG